MRRGRPPRPATVGFVLLLAWAVQSVPAAGLHEEGLHGLPIPYPEAGNDELSLAPRDWRVVDGRASVVDLEASARDPANGTLAFRLLAESAAMEAVLTAPGANQELEPLANIGVRWHAITFDPPIRFDEERTLRRVIPGALNWSSVEPSRGLAGDDSTAFMFWTSIPVPTNGTVAPDAETSRAGHVPDPDAIAWLVWWVSFTDEPRPDPDVGIRSPALARFGAGVLIDQDAVQSRVFDSVATISWHHDFVAVATGVSAETQGQLNATGLYVQRTTSYSVTRILEAAHLWGHNTTSVGARVSTVTTFDVPPYGRLPSSEPRSLLSPITLNATAVLRPVPDETAPWRLGNGPRVPENGHGVLVRGELGFLADQRLAGATERDDQDRDPDDNQTIRNPLPANMAALLVLVVCAALVRRRWAR